MSEWMKNEAADGAPRPISTSHPRLGKKNRGGNPNSAPSCQTKISLRKDLIQLTIGFGDWSARNKPPCG